MVVWKFFAKQTTVAVDPGEVTLDHPVHRLSGEADREATPGHPAL